VLAELGLLLLVPLVRLADLRDAADGHVGGKAEPLAKLDVTELLEQELVGEFPRERHARQPCRRLVELLDSRLELGGGFGVGQELSLERELHAPLILGMISPNKGRPAAIGRCRRWRSFLLMSKARGSLAARSVDNARGNSDNGSRQQTMHGACLHRG